MYSYFYTVNSLIIGSALLYSTIHVICYLALILTKCTTTNLFSQSALMHMDITKGSTTNVTCIDIVNNGNWNMDERRISQGKWHDE